MKEIEFFCILSKFIINLIEVVVVEEIEGILEADPDDHPYKLTFSKPQLKKQLTALVLSKTRNR